MGVEVYARNSSSFDALSDPAADLYTQRLNHVSFSLFHFSLSFLSSSCAHDVSLPFFFFFLFLFLVSPLDREEEEEGEEEEEDDDDDVEEEVEALDVLCPNALYRRRKSGREVKGERSTSLSLKVTRVSE